MVAQARKLPSGQWRVLVYAGKDTNGKRQYKSFTAATERKANLAALEWQEHYKEITRDSANMTVKEAIDAHTQSMSNILSPSTIAGYNRIKKNRMQGIIDIKLSKLTEKIIQNEINKEAQKYAPKTVSDTFGLLKTLLGKYRPGFKVKMELPTVYPVITSIPLDDDIRKLYPVAYNTEMELPILLACWLGLRVSEIRGLRMSDICEDRVIIRHAIVDGEEGPSEKNTKSKAGTRVLPLPEYIKSRIEALITDDREFLTSLSGQAIYKRFVRLCDKAGINRFRFHDLRHTNASVMLDENVPDKYIAERGGWGSDVYKKRYQHTTVKKNLSINDVLDARFESMLDDNMQHKMQHEKSE